jgi:hypothetical protein
MANEPKFGRSHRITRLTEKLRNKRYRDSYVDANVRRFLAQQFRALRGDMSQEEFGKLIGKPQSVVSRLEDPAYGKFALQTLLEVAASLNRAVVARIVDFPTFLRFTEDVSQQAICPSGYDPELLDRFALGLPPSTYGAQPRVHGRSALDAESKPFNQAHSLLLGGADTGLHAASASAQRENQTIEVEDREEDEPRQRILENTGTALAWSYH